MDTKKDLNKNIEKKTDEDVPFQYIVFRGVGFNFPTVVGGHDRSDIIERYIEAHNDYTAFEMLVSGKFFNGEFSSEVFQSFVNEFSRVVSGSDSFFHYAPTFFRELTYNGVGNPCSYLNQEILMHFVNEIKIETCILNVKAKFLRNFEG